MGLLAPSSFRQFSNHEQPLLKYFDSFQTLPALCKEHEGFSVSLRKMLGAICQRHAVQWQCFHQ